MDNFLAQIALAQINVIIGDIDGNCQKIISNIELAKAQNKKLIIFPELSICGYPPYDLLHFDSFIKKCNTGLQTILPFTQDIYVIVGLPTLNKNNFGKKLYNSAVVLYNQKIIHTVHKTLLPDYDVFDEYRYFEPNTYFEPIEILNTKVGLTICEDIWTFNQKPLYQINPVKELINKGAEAIINIAASPFHVGQLEKRNEILYQICTSYNVPIAYCNFSGAQTDLIFDGGSMLMNEKGAIKTNLTFFKEQLIETTSQISKNPISKIDLIHKALVLGIKDYFKKSGLQKAILGLSGGIDSAVTYALACEALGAENVLGVLMPSQYSSNHSIKDALDIVKNHNGNWENLTIESLFKSYEDKLKNVFEGYQPDLTEENIQARLRAVLLMAISNKKGYILLNTSNKSEAAVGYGTLYGDMCGAISVLGDVYKTDVFELAKWINRNRELIPVNSIVKPPSAELRPDQKDSDSLPDYAILDAILKLYVDDFKSKSEIIEKGFEPKIVEKVIKLVNFNEYKRFQTAPVLRVSYKAFGSGRKMPLVAKYLF
jgi:NAD+ synthase (glutamine-hydrolysing)